MQDHPIILASLGMSLLCGVLLLVGRKPWTARMAGVGAALPGMAALLLLALGADQAMRVVMLVLPAGLILVAAGAQLMLRRGEDLTREFYAVVIGAVLALSVAGWLGLAAF